MGDPQKMNRIAVVLGLALLLLGSGCAAITLRLREPGESNRTMPDAVATEYDCAKRALPFFELERVELLPQRVKRGKEINHRIVYVMCPQRPTEVVHGTLDTRILFRGKSIFSEAIEHELKPGRWVVDTFIPLSEQVEPGVYALQFDFRSRQGQLSARSDFVVTD